MAEFKMTPEMEEKMKRWSSDKDDATIEKMADPMFREKMQKWAKPEMANQQANQVASEDAVIPQDDGFSVREMVSNIPSSAKQFGADLINPIINYDKTIETFKQLGLKGTVKAVWHQYKSRYGTIDDALETLEKDPVGVMADISFVLTGPSAAVAKTPGIVGKTAGKVSKAAAAIDPVNLALSAGKATARAVPKGVKLKLYESGAKFGTTLDEVKSVRVVETALDNGLTPTRKGVKAAKALMDNIDNTIETLIMQAQLTGKTIPKDAIFRYLREVRKNLGGPTLEAAQDLKIIDKVAAKFDKQLKAIGKDRLSARDLQKFKRDAYSRAGKYGSERGTKKIAKQESAKAMGRAAKESLEELVNSPELNQLNKQWGRLIELKKPLQQASRRIENRNIFGLESPLMGAGGAVIGGPAGAAAGIALSILDKPLVKVRVALLLHNAQKAQLFENSLLRTLADQGLYQYGRTEEMQ